MLHRPRALPASIAALLGLLFALPALLAAAPRLYAAAPAQGDPLPTTTPAAFTPRSTPATPPATPRTPVSTPAGTVAQSTAEPSTTPTVTTAATVVFPQAEVLVERLRVRTGPNTTFPIVTRVFLGQTVRVTGRNGDCTWLRILTPDSMAGWVSAEGGLLVLNVECSTLPRTAALVLTPTATRSPTETPTATPTSTPSRSPLPPLFMRPLVAPRTPTPVPLPTRPALPTVAAVAGGTPGAGEAQAAVLPQPTPTPTADLLAALAVGGPQSVFGLVPEPGFVGDFRMTFSWTADAPLQPGQVFEVAFWRPGQGPVEGIGWTQATTDSAVGVNLGDQEPGDYEWGVWLGGFLPDGYRRIRFLGGGNPFRIPWEEEPSGPGPAPTAPGCPPDAPCRP